MVALDREFSQLRTLIPENGMLGGNRIVLSRCGIGKVNAAAGTCRLIKDYAPDCIISTGCAGGLGKDVRVMDIVVAQSLVYHDVWCGEGNKYGQVQGLPERFSSDPALVQKLRESAKTQGGARIHYGLMCSGDRFIQSREEEEAILRRFPEGLAVDMESCAIAQVCHIESVPFLGFRLISDSPSDDNRFAQYENFWETVADNSFAFVRSLLENL